MLIVILYTLIVISMLMIIHLKRILFFFLFLFYFYENMCRRFRNTISVAFFPFLLAYSLFQ